jgi:uncharacterized protein
MNPNPKMTWNAERLDVRAFALAGAKLQAIEPLTHFERLLEEAHLDNDNPPAALQVRWHTQGEARPSAKGGDPAVWLHLEAHASVPLTCQRCLGSSETLLQVNRWFRFVADEAAAEAEDDDCEEDVLAWEPRPNLHELLEDELLMELPLVPMHEACPVSVVMHAADPGVGQAVDEPQRPHPFAELARLRK